MDKGEETVEYTVQLNKQNGPIGITITGSESTPREITISALTPGIVNGLDCVVISFKNNEKLRLWDVSFEV